MDQVSRHLEERGHMRMTHAASAVVVATANIPGQANNQQHFNNAHQQTSHNLPHRMPEGGYLGDMATQPPPVGLPQKKKRGPKAGRKAAIAAAAAAAAATAAPADTLLASCWPKTTTAPTTTTATAPANNLDLQRPQSSGDPYTFHCDSMKINYNQNTLEATMTDRRPKQATRNEILGQQKQSRHLNQEQQQLVYRHTGKRETKLIQVQGNELDTNIDRHQPQTTSSFQQQQQNLLIKRTNHTGGDIIVDQGGANLPRQATTRSHMIAHQQHPVPAPQQVPQQRPPPQGPMHQHPIVGPQSVHHHGQLVDQQQQQQYYPGEQQQQQQQQQYATPSQSNTSSADHQIYQQPQQQMQQLPPQNHHHIHHNHHPQQQQVRFRQQPQQEVSNTPLDHRLNSYSNGHRHNLQSQQQQYNHHALDQQPQPVPPQSAAQHQQPLPTSYHHAHHHQQQQQAGYDPQAHSQLVGDAQPPTLGQYGHPPEVVAQVSQPLPPQQQLVHHHHPQQPKLMGHPVKAAQTQRASPYHASQQQQQHPTPVRAAVASQRGLVVSQQQQYKRDLHHPNQQPQHIPQQQLVPAPQAPPPQPPAAAGYHPAAAGPANSYPMNGPPPPPMQQQPPSFVEAQDHHHHNHHQQHQQQQQYPLNSPTLLQQQLNRQPTTVAVGPPRLGPAPPDQPGPLNPQPQRPGFASSGPQPKPTPAGLPPSSGGRYMGGEPDLIEPYQGPDYGRPQQQQPQGPMGPVGQPLQPPVPMDQPRPSAEPHYYRTGPQPPVQRAGPMAPQRGPMAPNSMLDHQFQQPQPQQLPHLLGNPTPPLTPNSNPSHMGPAVVVPQPQQRTLAVGANQGGQPLPVQENSQWPTQQQHHHNNNNHHHHGGPLSEHVQQHPPAGFNGSLSMNKQPNQHQTPEVSSNGQPQRIMPKNVNNFQSLHNHHHQQQPQQQYHSHNNNHHHHAPTSQVSMAQSSSPNQAPPHPLPLPHPNPHHQHHHHHHHHHQQQQQQPHPHPHPGPGQSDLLPGNRNNNHQTNANSIIATDLPIGQTRLTLPLRDAPLMGPFRLEHDAQFTSKVFHIKSQLFETLSKSMGLMNPQTATVVQELQFRAYIVKSSSGSHHGSVQQGDSLLAPNNNSSQLHQPTKACSWPELFQLSVNQNVIQLDRSKANHRAVDIFQYCQMGDNMLDIQVNDCYCTHEFVLEAVDRPTLKAFMNSCFKSRLLSSEGCIQKMKFNFGSPGFLVQSPLLQQSAGLFNEYITEFVQGIEQTRTRISMRCPISSRRMKTPTRGYNCKHLQCFDLESFLYLNRERSRWNCPICSLSIPFTMLELDQHQINIVQAMSEILNTDDILIDGAGQWQAYYANPVQQHQANQGAQLLQPSQQQQPHPQRIIPQPTIAKSSGTYHPQPPAPTMSGVGSPIAQQPTRPMSGPVVTSRLMGPGSPASWHDSPHNQHPQADVPSPAGVGGPMRRPASAISQPTGRRSANGSPLAKKAYSGQYSQPQQQQQQSPANALQQMPPNAAPQGPSFFNGGVDHQNSSLNNGGNNTDNIDDLSPLAAMERTIIQHEQQMGPPPFDPNSLTSSPASSQQRQPTVGTNNPNSIISHSPGSVTGGPATTSGGASMIQASPSSQQQQAAFSPASHGPIPSPAARLVPASPQQQRGQQPAEGLPQSPMQQQQPIQTNTSISTPATPSSTMLVHGGPETPATPSNSGGQQHCGGPNSVSAVVMSHSPHIGTVNGGQASNSSSGVDHQPLSNGSASAGSITSTSTMTPSGQSLGSVGMGGDSRCGTAPLQGVSLGLDDLMLPGNSTHNVQSGSGQYGGTNSKGLMGNSPHIDESNEILMGKLLMDSGESILRDHRNGDQLAMALEEVDWKQHQLDRGKSEHLANFLNEPLMKKQQQQHYQQHHQGNNKMLSGGLNPSDDEGNQSHGSSPGHNLDQLEFANYLDADTVDNGAGLPPDDSILDLFER